jgi:hypothetical protein
MIKIIIYRNSYILRKNNVSLNNFILNIQNFPKNIVGGGKVLQIKYKDVIYKYEKYEDTDYYVLYSHDENKYDCASVIISKEDRLAEVHGISNYTSCLQSTNENIGSNLLQITLKLLKKHRTELGIDKISLTDNSIKKCGKTNVILSKMLILLSGHTWYGKYNFRPYDIYENKINEFMNKQYENNINIMNKLTIKDAHLLEYIQLTNNTKLINELTILLKKYPNILLKEYIGRLLNNYDNKCKYFSIFYEKLFTDIGLHDFYKQSFVLIL